MPAPKDKTPNEPIKVTDKRIFTAEGEIREEYRKTVTPTDPSKAAPPPPPPPPHQERREQKRPDDAQAQADKKRRITDKGVNPGTAFTNFIESLVLQAYMSLGMLRNPYQPQAQVDLNSARQLIDILNMLAEKTKGNLTEDEIDFLGAHLSELKLAYVQRSKSIG